MASEDGNVYRMDPTEMLWPCAVRVTWAGEEVVVEISTGTDGETAATPLPSRVPGSPQTSYRNAA